MTILSRCLVHWRLGAFLLGAAAGAQPPAIFHDGVSNAASSVTASLPFGGFAPGTRVAVQGVRLDHPTLIIITAGASRKKARTLKVEDKSAEFLLPGDLPAGPAELIVEADGGPSRPFPVTIVGSAFGIRAVRRSGRTITLEGSGIGNGAGEIEVVIGGKPLRPSAIHSDKNGDERIDFRLPAQVAAGCHVPLYVRTKSHVSNFVDLADLPGCADEPWPILAPRKGGTGSLLLLRSTLDTATRSWTADSTYGAVLGVGKASLQVPLWFPLGTGQCRLEFSATEGGNQDPLRMMRIDKPGMKTISAGPFLSLGVTHIPVESNGIYKSTLGGNSPLMRRPKPLFFESGKSYSIGATENKAGRFQVMVPFVDDLEFNAPEARTIDRMAPLRVRWRTLQPQVAIVMYSQNDSSAVQAICAARGSDGQFTIPADVLRSLPVTVSATGSLTTGYVGVAALGRPTAVAAPGLKQVVGSSVRLRLTEIEFR